MATHAGAERRFRYGVAVAASLLAYLLRAVLGPALVPSSFLPFYGSVLVSAWYGGFAPAALSIAIADALALQVFLPFESLSYPYQ